MARNGSGVYSLPAGTAIVNGDVSDASDLNTPFDDLESDANIARPVVAGGTGATTAGDARTNLGLDTMATQSAGAVAITGGTATLSSATISGGTATLSSITAGGTDLVTVKASEFIATADASSDSAVTFTGFDATKYDAYMIVLQNVVPATDAVGLELTTSTNGGSSYDAGASDYVYAITGYDSVTTSNTNTSSTGTDRILILSSRQLGSAAGEEGVSGTVFICGPHLNKKTIVVFSLGYFGDNGSFVTATGAGARDDASDVDAVQLAFNTGDIESGTFTLYGIRNGS